jgi:CheY-like chemotaxis protein
MTSILIIDDDETFRKIVCRYLENEDLQVIEADNGDEGLKIFTSMQPEIVLIDLVMPKKDGLTAIQEIVAMNPHTKIVAVSGGLVFLPYVYLDEARAVGSHFTLPKPFDRQQLIHTIHAALHE